jgi:hypothetical protein
LFGLGLTLVSWNNKRQSRIAMSSTKVEYRALTEGNKEATWLKSLIGELGFL